MPFWDHREMARCPDIDIIDCGTRPDYRKDMVLAALQNGRHVYNGIPFADSFASSRELIQAWRGSGLAGGVDAFLPWIPAHRLMKEMIDDGFLGRPFACNLHFHISLFNRAAGDFPYLWFQHARHGCSALRNLGSHALHLLIDLFGDVASVVAFDAQYLDRWELQDGSVIEPQVNDTAAVMLRFDSGMIANLQPSWNVVAGGQGWMLEAYGSRGRLRAQAPPPFPNHATTSLYAGDLAAAGLEPVAIPERLRVLPNGAAPDGIEPLESVSMAWAFQDLATAVRSGAACRPGFAQAWKVECILEAARRSQQSRAWVDLADVG